MIVDPRARTKRSTVSKGLAAVMIQAMEAIDGDVEALVAAAGCSSRDQLLHLDEQGELTRDSFAHFAREAFQCHVASALDSPFVVLFEQDGTDEACDGVLVGEDTDDFGAALDLAVEALERIRGVQLGSMLRREAHIGKLAEGLIARDQRTSATAKITRSHAVTFCSSDAGSTRDSTSLGV